MQARLTNVIVPQIQSPELALRGCLQAVHQHCNILICEAAVGDGDQAHVLQPRTAEAGKGERVWQVGLHLVIEKALMVSVCLSVYTMSVLVIELSRTASLFLLSSKQLKEQ